MKNNNMNISFSIQSVATLQKSLGSSRASFAGMYFLYMLYNSWNEARDGKPPCIKSKTDTMPIVTNTHTHKKLTLVNAPVDLF